MSAAIKTGHGPCARCKRPMLPRDNPRSTHQKSGRGLCASCWNWAKYHGRLADYGRLTRSRDDLLDDYVLLRSQGYNWRQCAQRLGMTYAAFEGAMFRARRDRDPRAGRIGEKWPPVSQVAS